MSNPIELLEKLKKLVVETPVTRWQVVSPVLQTDAQKREHALRLRRTIAPDLDSTSAIRYALEEYAHARGDAGKPGVYGLRRNIIGKVVEVGYAPLGPRTTKQRYAIYTAGLKKGLISSSDFSKAVKAALDDRSIPLVPLFNGIQRKINVIDPQIDKRREKDQLR